MGQYRDRPHGFREALQAAREILQANHDVVAKGSVETEAEQLVLAAYREATGKKLTRLELFSRYQDPYPVAAADRLLILAGIRAEGKPLQHATGVQVFLDHEYEVGPEVLIPRPETEVLVTAAMECLKKQPQPPGLGLEVGAGSGAISIELLSSFPGLRMLASELTPEAMARAERNARRILQDQAYDRFQLLRVQNPSLVLEPFESELGSAKADFIISNPPYLITTDPIEREVIQYEPGTALFAPEAEPLYFYERIAQRGKSALKPGGLVFVELASERAAQVQKLFEAEQWKEVMLLPDLSGRSRVLVASSDGTG